MREAFWTIAGVCILALLMLAGTHKLYRDANKAAILTSAFFLLMFSFGHVIRSVSYLLSAVGLLEQGQSLVRGELADIAWLMVWAVRFTLVAVTLWKYPRDLNSASRIMSFVTWVALLTVLGQWMLREFRQPSGKIETFIANWKTSSLDMDIQTGSAGADPLPDIYYIILDGLGREDVLKSYYQLDLTEFRSELEDYGFYIADQSFSNYAWTELSLTSALNFSYLDELKDLGLETSDTTPLEVMVDHNRLFDMLRARDYQIITFADEYELTDVTNADVYLSPQRWVLNGFQNELLNTTPRDRSRRL